MFSVDFETLRQIIQQLLYTGVFRAQVSASRTFSEEGYIELQVKEGVIYGCYFVSKQGKTYKWDQWDIRLTQSGVLDWKLSQELSSGPPPQGPSSPSLSASGHRLMKEPMRRPTEISYHVVTLSQAQLHQWPTLHRQVYSLIDGRRGSSEIAQILHKELSEIEWIIQELRQRGFIQIL